MLTYKPEKVISISQYINEDKSKVFIYFNGLETLRNPIVVERGNKDSMSELLDVLKKLLNVNVIIE